MGESIKKNKMCIFLCGHNSPQPYKPLIRYLYIFMMYTDCTQYIHVFLKFDLSFYCGKPCLLGLICLLECPLVEERAYCVIQSRLKDQQTTASCTFLGTQTFACVQ